MSSHVCGVTLRILQLARASSTRFSPWIFPVKESHVGSLPGICRVFCSAVSTPPVDQDPRKGLTMRSLTDMGFSETQADVVYEGARKNRCRQDAPILTGLFALGLNPASVVKILEKCPELYTLKEAHLQQRVLNLRKLGLLEGSLQRLISHYPEILCLPVKRVSGVCRLLREKCLFTAQQVTDILRDSPRVVQEEHTSLEYKFQYAYFRMGCRQAEMVKAKLFRLPMEELRCRHVFLERRGLYQTPDKKGQTLIINPLLKDFLPVSEETYLTKFAMATQEELDVFRKLIAREQEEEREQNEDSTDDEDDECDEDDTDDEDEVDERHTKQHTQNTGYNKRRKQGVKRQH